jgi:hypothetical protein
MPLMTSRFRRGFTPRRCSGIDASIDAYCSSLSQNRFNIIALPQRGSFESNPMELRQARIEFRA